MPKPSLLRISWISRGWTLAGGARDRCFEGKLPKAIRVISPIAPPSRNNWVISPLVPPRNSLGHQPYCSSLGTVWVIILLFLPRDNLGHQPCCSPSEQLGSSALSFPQGSGPLGPHLGCCRPPCRIDRARGVESVESVKELDLERENSF